MNKKLVFVSVFVLILFQACASPSPAPVIDPKKTATLVPPTSTPTPTVTPTSTPTPIPLAWTQVYDGQDFERDTVTAFATDKINSNIIYAGMKNSGVYKTVDGGLSWLPVNQGLTSTKVVSLFIDSQYPLILYAGTIGGIFKTEDGGGNWSKVGEGTYLLMDNQNNSHLYARNENAIYETHDQGSSWSIAYPLSKDCPNTIRSWAIHPTEGNTLFVGGGEECEPGIYQSSDSGRSWVLIGMEGKTNIDPIAIGVDEQGNHSIYVQHISLLGGDLHGVYTSHDGGSSWHKSEGNFSCEILATDPNNPSTIYCASKRLYVMSKKGATWQELPGTYSKLYSIIHIDYPKGTNRILTGGIDVSNTGDPKVGIFISRDIGISWEQQNNGLGSTRAEIKIDPLDGAKIYLATYFGDFAHSNSFAKCLLYRSQDRGNTWSLVKWRGGDWCGPSFDTDHVLYLIESNSLQKSFNSGETWLWDAQGKPVPKDISIDRNAGYRLPAWDTGATYQSLSANPYLDGYVYAIGNTIYYSTDSGVSWQISTGSEGLWDARLFYANKNIIIYAIGRYRQKYSTDNGMTWQACREDVTTSQSDSRLALDLQGERLYLATPGRGVLVSTDKCGSWQESNNGLGNLFVNTIAMDPNNNNILYAGTDGGAYVTFDGGGTWGQVNNGLIGSTIVYSIAIDSESSVYAATPYGVFKLEQK